MPTHEGVETLILGDTNQSTRGQIASVFRLPSMHVSIWGVRLPLGGAIGLSSVLKTGVRRQSETRKVIKAARITCRPTNNLWWACELPSNNLYHIDPKGMGSTPSRPLKPITASDLDFRTLKFVRGIIQSNFVIIFSKTTCSYCYCTKNVSICWKNLNNQKNWLYLLFTKIWFLVFFSKSM